MTNIVVAGASGRMGRAVLNAAFAAPGIVVAGAFDRADNSIAGKDIGELIDGRKTGITVQYDATAVLSAVPQPAQTVVIDFTRPEASLAILSACRLAGCALVTGTTGFTAHDDKHFVQAGQSIAIIKSGNMSLGVALLSALVKQAAQSLGPDFDIEVVEAHHQHKVDAPSGTALMLGNAAAHGRNTTLDDVGIFERSGRTEPRRRGDIGFAVVRGGGIIGDHAVHFAGASEVITLGHRALDRRLFADGALQAARWLMHGPAGQRAPGLYTINDVLTPTTPGP